MPTGRQMVRAETDLARALVARIQLLEARVTALEAPAPVRKAAPKPPVEK
jgi:hypothetical protein